MTFMLWDQPAAAWVPFYPDGELPDPGLDTWPSAANVGYLGDPEDLVDMSGSTISTPNTVIEGRRIYDAIRPNAGGIRIRNCILEAGWFGVDATSAASGLIIEDCTIIGGLNCGISLDNVTGAVIRRCNISGGADGIKVGGSNLVVQDNYIHDLSTSEGSHNDGVQCSSATGLIFRHNWIESPDTSCIAMFDGQGSWNNVLIENNHLTGPGYPLYGAGASGSYIQVKNNRFGEWGYGPVSDWDSAGLGNVWSGNYQASNGASVNP
jgi:hypothetical protein